MIENRSMPTQTPHLESLAVRRAHMVDAEKVRYRVYRSPTEFIAVIAESALMAVKVAGIPEPYRIVRDLPTETVALEAEKLARDDIAQEKVVWPTTRREKPAFNTASFKETSAAAKFVPLKLRDLTSKQGAGLRVLPPEALDALVVRMAEAKPSVLPVPPTPVVAEKRDPDTLTPEEVEKLLQTD
jgi:hypothetical protein